MTAASNWSIAQRLSAGFGLLILILSAFVALITWQLAQNDRASETLDTMIVNGQQIEEFERSVFLLAVSTRDFLRDSTREQLAVFEAAEQRLNRAMRALEPRASAQELVLLGGQYASLSRQAVTQREVASADLVQLRQNILAHAQPITTQHDAEVEAALERMRANRETARVVLIIGVAASGLLFLGVGILTTRSVTIPARELVGVAEALRNGDWRPALQLDREDPTPDKSSANEIAQIGRAFGSAATELELREQRLAAHAAIANASGASLDKTHIAEAVLRTVLQHVHAEVGAFFIEGTETDTLVPVASQCVMGKLMPVRLGEGLVGQCAQDRQTVVWRDIPPLSAFSVGIGYDQAPPRSVAATPLVAGGDLLGVLVVASLRDFDDGAISFLEAAASIVTVGLMNARAYEEMKQLLARLQEQSERIQAQNEELQAQNEELYAQGEELQAQSEELQAQGEELQAQNEELQAQSDDLQRQTSRLHEQAGAMREADEHKNAFLGLLAHELRNPLTPITNCVELLSRRRHDPHVVVEVEKLLGRQVRHLRHLVDDLLDVTRVSGGKVALKREHLNLIELVKQCIDDHRVALDQSGVSLSMHLPEVPIYIDGDHTRICQVFFNLLGNACKFCQPGSSVSVDVTLDAPSRFVAIHVADTGEGIEPDMLPRIFEPFFQADTDLARTRGGLGLGLALTKGLVELHGGRLEARSAGKGCGAEFIVNLPLADVAEHAPKAPDGKLSPQTAGQSLSLRVLLIDDNADAAVSLATLLELDGCQVQVASTARSGIDKATRFSPDAILCDIGLPVMNGFAFAREVRQHTQLRSVLLIALTGYSSTADQQNAADAGFDLLVTKPADYASIVEILRNPAAARRHGETASPGEPT